MHTPGTGTSRPCCTSLQAVLTAATTALVLSTLVGCVTPDPGNETGSAAPRTPRRRLPRNADITTRKLFELESEDSSVRHAAADYLEHAPAERRPEVVAALARALKDPDRSVRTTAAASLYGLKADAAPAAPQLREALSDPYGKVVINAALTLRRLDEPREGLVPPMRVVLDGRNLRLVPSAASILVALGVPLSEVMPRLLTALGCNDVEARREAARELLDHKVLPQSSAAAVQARLADPDADVRSHAAILLGAHYDPPPQAALPALIDLLQREQEGRVQSSLVLAVRHYGPAARAAGPRLVELALKSPDKNLRGSCPAAIASIKYHADDAVSALRTLLRKDEDRSVRVAAAHALADFGTAAIPALADFEAAAQDDPEIYVRKMVARDLGILLGGFDTTSQEAVPFLVRYVGGSEDETMRLQAVRALGRIGHAPAEVVPVLAKALLEDTSWRVRTAATSSLAEFGDKAKPALDALRKAKENDAESHVKTHANIAIQRIEGTWGKPAAP